LNLTVSQIAGLAANAGFSGNDLATAVAVAMAESQGNPQAYNPEKAAGAAQGQGSFGLWQIYLAAHPEFASENLLDPQINAAAAFAVYSNAGNSFHPWTTFTSGTYQAYMGAVVDFLNASAAPASAPEETASMGAPDGSQTLMMIGAGALALLFLMWAFNGS